MPHSVKVRDEMYSIEVWDKTLAEQARAHGRCERYYKRILIDISHGDLRIAATLLHEILHAIYWEHSLQDNDGEEDIVQSFERGLMQVFVDSPDVLAFIGEAIIVDSQLG
jgi:hypothetical protein